MSPLTHATACALLAVPALAAVVVGWRLLRAALAQRPLRPEELARAAAWVFVVGGLVWLERFLTGTTLLGFDRPWTGLAAAHFGAAGFGALTVTAGCCRVVADPRALRVLRTVLVLHPVAYLIIAAGISGAPFADQLGATLYELLFVAQLGAALLGRPERIDPSPRRLLLLALGVPVLTLIPALAWAWGSPFLDLAGMVRAHGVVNAVGHVGLGLVALAWGRPPLQPGDGA